jgi:hypothetical protein
MRPKKKPDPKPDIVARPRAAPDAAPVSVADKEAARRALDQTRDALRSGDIAKAGAKAAAAIESSLAGKPEPVGAEVITARVVAVGDAKKGIPSIPLEGLTVRLKVEDKVIEESATDRLGLVSLPIGRHADAAYEMEVLGPDCGVVACQSGRAGAKSPAAHLIELPRTAGLKPQIERAKPLEDVIRKARERAAIAEEVVRKALTAQEKRLVEYLDGLDNAAPEPSKKRDKPKS